jgi:endonuclease YncB( thermonuclease family)
MSVSGTGPHPASTQARNRWLLLFLVAVVVVGFIYGIVRMATYDPYYVVWVYDADRLKLKSNDGVVLIGVECPPSQDKQIGEAGCLFTKKLLMDRYIRVETDVDQKDPSGWIRGYVFVKNNGQELFLNEELLRLGFARLKLVFPNLKYRVRLEAAEAEAKSKKIGLWSPDYKPPGS